jgi:hypothetical protein
VLVRKKEMPNFKQGFLKEASLAYIISLLICLFIYQLRYIPFLKENLHALIACMFIYIPVWAIRRRRESLEDFGIHLKGVWKEIGFAFLCAIIVFPLFWIGFKIYWNIEQEFSPRFDYDFFNVVLAQFIVVAFPEEFFYRGYLQGRFNQVFKSRLKILKAEVGYSVLLTSALFAIGHFLVEPYPQRLGVFFPSLLFGWMREKRRSIVSPIIFHGLCNIFMDILIIGYFSPSNL